eukprot:1539413-Prymnesium_polylepis.1
MPQLSAVTPIPESVSTFWGVGALSRLLPRPSCPELSSPQQKTSPEALSAAVWYFPHDTCTIVSSWSASMGTGTSRSLDCERVADGSREARPVALQRRARPLWVCARRRSRRRRRACCSRRCRTCRACRRSEGAARPTRRRGRARATGGCAAPPSYRSHKVHAVWINWECG